MITAYHGTPITPNWLIEELCKADRHFCVSYYRPDQVEIIDRLATSYFLDNGAFSAWLASERKKIDVVFDRAYWEAFYDFARRWVLGGRAAWFVIPDVINAGTQEQDALLKECPADLAPFGVPVWHMDEPISRALGLIDRFGRMCVGSTAEFRIIGSPAWRERMDETWSEIDLTFKAVPPVHMLRGMQCLGPGFEYPFSSMDSTDLARNHNRLKKRFGAEHHGWALKKKADRWDAMARVKGTHRFVKRHRYLPGFAA